MVMPRDIIVIGSSAGGVTALRRLLSQLPPRPDACVAIVQHRPATGADHLLEVLTSALGSHSPWSIRQAVDGDVIRPGQILLAPADQHLLLGPEAVQVAQGPMENMSRPAIDPLFRSAALMFGPRVVGIVLSGELDDGSLGLVSIARRGGLAVVQDPDEAAFQSMPLHALERNAGALRLRLAAIAQLLGAGVPMALPDASPPATPSLAAEVAMSRGDRDFHAELDRLGTPSGLTCPECQGALWRVPFPGMDQYRCHIGHAYSENALEAGQIQAQERALGTALKTVEERIRIYQILADRLRQRHPQISTNRFDDMIMTLSEDARQLRRMLWRGAPAALSGASGPDVTGNAAAHQGRISTSGDLDDQSHR